MPTIVIVFHRLYDPLFSFQCPGCSTFVERTNVSNLSVECSICTTRTGRTYEFCWQCLKPWKGPRPRADQCDNEGCSKDLQLLKNCEMITLKSVKNIRVPSIRACPTCGTLIEHNTEKCKNIKCYHCGREFCFSCLKITSECLKTSKHFSECSDGVAPKQTSIPSNTIQISVKHISNLNEYAIMIMNLSLYNCNNKYVSLPT